MTEYTITEISNGWVLTGPLEPAEHIVGGPEPEMFLPNIYAVAEILKIWQIQGFIKAMARAKEKYEGAKWQ